MKVLVTGAAGFIGSHLCEGLLKAGYEVRGIDNLSTGRIGNLKNIPIEFLHNDITLPHACMEAVKGVEIVFHQAALGSVPRSIDFPISTYQSNVMGTLNLLEACRKYKVKKFIYASSSSVYGDNPDSVKDEKLSIVHSHPLSPYAASKLAVENLAHTYELNHGIDTVGLRYFNVFGPRQLHDSNYGAVIPKWIHAMKNNDPVYINGDGKQRRDFTYVQNVVDANLRVTKHWGYTIYNVACGKSYELRTVFKTMSEIIGYKKEPVHLDPRPGDVRTSEASVFRLKELMYGSLIDFDRGLKETIKAYSDS